MYEAHHSADAALRLRSRSGPVQSWSSRPRFRKADGTKTPIA